MNFDSLQIQRLVIPPQQSPIFIIILNQSSSFASRVCNLFLQLPSKFVSGGYRLLNLLFPTDFQILRRLLSSWSFISSLLLQQNHASLHCIILKCVMFPFILEHYSIEKQFKHALKHKSIFCFPFLSEIA